MAFRQSPEVIEKHRKEREEVRVLHGATGNSVHYEAPQVLDSDAISKIIKQGTGLDEDAYQDAWLRVVEENIKEHPYEFEWDKVHPHWRHHVPHPELELTKIVAARLGVSPDWIFQRCREGRIQYLEGRQQKWFVHPKDVQFCIDHPEGSREHPYRVMDIMEKLHYITSAARVGDDWEVTIACKKPRSQHWKGKVSRLIFSDRCPTCKVCISVMRQWQQRLLQGEALVPHLVEPDRRWHRKPKETAQEPIKCKWCHGENVSKYGTRYGVQLWFCRVCRRKFTGNDSLPHMRYPREMVETALELQRRGFSYDGIRRELLVTFQKHISDATICHWVNHHPKALRGEGNEIVCKS